jgi:hypothetical protein
MRSFAKSILTRLEVVRLIDMRPRKLGFDLGDRGYAILRKPAHPVSQSSALRIILALLVLSSVFSSAQTQSQSPTGIEGVITVSPIRPGPIRAGADIPNRGPFANTPFVVQSEKATVTSFTTDDQGRFRVSLAPGHYTVSPKEWNGGPGHCGPFDVDVVAGRITHVEWRCDSGMR